MERTGWDGWPSFVQLIGDRDGFRFYFSFTTAVVCSLRTAPFFSFF